MMSLGVLLCIFEPWIEAGKLIGVAKPKRLCAIGAKTLAVIDIDGVAAMTEAVLINGIGLKFMLMPGDKEVSCAFAACIICKSAI